ncbi:extracellular solute-binding protein [Phormidium sp. LEGE 05292]|uniref:ABC transporter substrate-binding protein n=1 Tax=[Phormidium] sp. LEGE 05292 TaxID=767427 RepID=UPI0018820275|nr:extracellular solute-binding protein [Phormidium sp. LEGE 05292]MBE9229848.1 extracellular solute-binding protein [Phormidium sp. LEGE 05292]
MKSLALNRRNFLKTALAATSGLVLSSCGWTLAQVRPSTTDKGNPNKLYIYTWSGYTNNELLNKFTENTSVAAIANVFDSNEAMLAKIQAGGGADYSIIYPSDYMVRQMLELGLLQELDHDRLSGLNNLMPQFKNPEYDPGNRHSVPISWGTTGLIYNSKKLEKPPEDWDYLWQNQQTLSKRMTLMDDVREVMGATLRMLGYSYNSTNPEEVRQAYEKLKILKPAIASFTTDAWKEQILAGDLLIAMGYSADAIEVTEENPDLKYVIPRSGTSLWTDTMVIPKNAPNPEAAYAWISFMLEPSVAALVTETLNFATPNSTALKELPEKITKNVTLFPPESVLTRAERISPIGKFSEVYENYWTQLRSS